MKIRNICPIGDLDIPLLKRIVAAGEVVEVDADHAARLLPQRSNYEPADDEAIAVLAEIDKAEAAAPVEPPAVPVLPTDDPPLVDTSGAPQSEGTDPV